MNLTLDAGALIAFERGSDDVREHLRFVRQRGGTVAVPATVVAQTWRSPRQADLARLLKGRDVAIVALDTVDARAVGALLALSGTRDVVDAHVVLVARRFASGVLTSDPDDLHRLDPQIVTTLV